MPDTRKPKFFYGYVIVLASFLIVVVGAGIFYSFGVFFKPLLAEFGWTRATIAGAFSVAIFLSAFLGIVSGMLNDRFGPRILVTACGLLMGLGCILMSQISTIWQLYLFYGGLIGIGMGSIFIPLLSTVARWFTKRRGLMTGIFVSGAGVGVIIMPPVTSWLISIYGWRTSYTVMGIITLVLIIAAAQFLRRDPNKIGEMPYGENEVKQDSPVPQVRNFPFLEVIHTTQFWILSIMFSCFGFSLQSIMVHLVNHATDLGISAIIAANILAVIGGSSIAGRIALGSVSDRSGSKPVFMVSFILFSVALLWLLVARELWMLYLFAAVFGFAYGGLITLLSPAVAELFGMNSHGVIVGTVMFAMAIGEAIGPVIAGHIFDITHNYQPAFLVCAILSVAGLGLTAFLKPTQGKRETSDLERSA